MNLIQQTVSQQDGEENRMVSNIYAEGGTLLYKRLGLNQA